MFAYTNVAVPFTERIGLALGLGVRRGEDGCLRDRLVVEATSAGEEFTSLGAFETCVRLLSEILCGPCGAS